MKIKNLLLVLVASVTLWGCSDDNDDLPFDGTDNTVNSFSLTTAAGEKYVAEISGDNIGVTVPLNVSLAGARVEYAVCELATVSPSPESISDWDATQTFTVEAYDGSVRKYTYSVTRVQVPSEGSVILKTQADVAALAASGITVISGDMVIGDNIIEEDDPVTDLSALTGIIEVSQNIIVRRSFAGTSLAGLENIRTAAGLFVGDYSSTLETVNPLIISMPGLKSVGQLVLNSSTVEELRLDALEDAGWIFLSSTSVKNMSFAALKTCTTNLTMKPSSGANRDIESVSFPVLEKVGADFTAGNYGMARLEFPELASVGGKLTVSNLPAIEAVDFPALKRIGGSASLQSINTVKSIRMPSLTCVNGNASVDALYASGLAELKLNKLDTVKGELQIRLSDRTEMDDLVLPSLRQVTGRLTIYQYGKASTFALDNLTDCPDVYLVSVNGMRRLDLSADKTLDRLNIISCVDLAELSLKETISSFEFNAGQEIVPQIEITGLKNVTGTFEVSGMKNEKYHIPSIAHVGAFRMTSASGIAEFGMPDLESAGTFTLNVYTLVATSFPKLASVSGNFEMNSIRDSKGDATDFSSLKTVGGTFKLDGIWGNTSKFENLSGFKALESAKSVSISAMPQLKDFAPLKKVAESLTTASAWTVRTCGYNPTLNDMKEGKYTE